MYFRKANPDVYNYIRNIPFGHAWSRVHYHGNAPRLGVTSSNYAEQYFKDIDAHRNKNALGILSALLKDWADTVLSRNMKWNKYCENKNNSKNTPALIKEINKQKSLSKLAKIKRSKNGLMVEVNGYRIRDVYPYCECGYFVDHRCSCLHMLKAQKLVVEEIWEAEYWRNAYELACPHTTTVDLPNLRKNEIRLPPAVKPSRGRKRKSRIQSVGEEMPKRKKKIHKP